MNTNDLLNLDYNVKHNQLIIQKALRKIKPLANYDLSEDIPLLKLELLVVKYEKKYPIIINYIEPTSIPGEINCYRAVVRNTNTGEILKTIYGCCLYELFCKLSIYFYYVTSKGEIQKNG